MSRKIKSRVERGAKWITTLAIASSFAVALANDAIGKARQSAREENDWPNKIVLAAQSALDSLGSGANKTLTLTAAQTEKAKALIPEVQAATSDSTPSATKMPNATRTPTPTKKAEAASITVPKPQEEENTVSAVIEIPLTQADINFMATHEIRIGDKNKKNVALTFDAGAGPDGWLKIRDIFQKYGFKTTIFVTGDFINKNPNVVREMLSKGMEIGNHSMNHPDFTAISGAQIKAQIVSFQQALDKVAGRHVPVRFFRFPSGIRNVASQKTIAEMGLQSVLWTRTDSNRTWDWQEKTSQEELFKVLKGDIEPGLIHVMHIENAKDVYILNQVLPFLIQQGYRVTPVSEMIAQSDLSPSITLSLKSNSQARLSFKLP